MCTFPREWLVEFNEWYVSQHVDEDRQNGVDRIANVWIGEVDNKLPEGNIAMYTVRWLGAIHSLSKIQKWQDTHQVDLLYLLLNVTCTHFRRNTFCYELFGEMDIIVGRNVD